MLPACLLSACLFLSVALIFTLPACLRACPPTCMTCLLACASLAPRPCQLVFTHLLTTGCQLCKLLDIAHAGRSADVSYVVEGSQAHVVFGAFSSLGAIFLLFGLTVLLEIQASAAWAALAARTAIAAA